jgi:hypothetical protein
MALSPSSTTRIRRRARPSSRAGTSGSTSSAAGAHGRGLDGPDGNTAADPVAGVLSIFVAIGIVLSRSTCGGHSSQRVAFAAARGVAGERRSKIPTVWRRTSQPLPAGDVALDRPALASECAIAASYPAHVLWLLTWSSASIDWGGTVMGYAWMRGMRRLSLTPAGSAESIH